VARSKTPMQHKKDLGADDRRIEENEKQRRARRKDGKEESPKPLDTTTRGVEAERLGESPDAQSERWPRAGVCTSCNAKAKA
jgi:hypothetical protein